MHYGADRNSDFNGFYKLPSDTVAAVLDMFLKKYFESDNWEDAEKKNPDVKWLYPLAWFRAVTSLLKGSRWPEEKRNLALRLLREKLIPFINENS